MKLTTIVAVGQNMEIGKDNKLLWDLPRDLEHFRQTTKGKTVIMGRKTFDSIGRPLPGRRNMVLTRDKNWRYEGVEVFYSVEDLLASLINPRDISGAKNPPPISLPRGEAKQAEEAFVIGGAGIYQLFMPFISNLNITFVKADFPEADTFFPEIDFEEWREISSAEFEKDEKNEFNFTIKEYERIN